MSSRVPPWRSFAFRLGAGFAVAAIAAAGITALVVNAAFAARFSQYLAGQQQAGQHQQAGVHHPLQLAGRSA